ncbi:beta-glucan synthesis-associated protein KRE6 KNAG_0A08020 [Huiozyma naganishii CBS 8797]|uniref:GH16 domain-containing protein n=1 Tax=Huiozyma naganishii (strain ATCC MYA-139 / BCRC 22969 / CBS 8797 / KCTC 17520 / NBRC 10181 / NCYC 3082 / Yp74L-3) TaxID=1071383 RepID=J7R0X5_HUIN7|nr:hypothetical protein KNAG_0A08020 [Kazachstania naganishii CBS 8797]CCK68455.1 hypothetical protein KNAG_0A08020 [Kazachstania naganishii CBS 8797]
MPVRNLTDSNLNLNESSENVGQRGGPNPYDALTNPFLDSNDEFGDMRGPQSGSSSMDRQQDSGYDHMDDADFTQKYSATNGNITDYKGYYSRNASAVNQSANDTTAFLPQGRGRISSASPNPPIFDANEILTPPAFDRYPLVGSKAASQTNLNSQLNSGSYGNLHNQRNVYSGQPSPRDGSNSTFSSSNPFNQEQDFSPFGGYPTTSFPLLMDDKEDDDYLHNPDPEEEAKLDRKRFIEDFKHMDRRAFSGFMGIIILFSAAAVVFVVLPALTFTGVTNYGPKYEVVEFLTGYQYPQLSAIRTSLVDPDTPEESLTRKAKDGSSWKLVFSDEFNAEGRTFYEGDDQFWTGPDIHYDATKDLEWYSPDASTTKNGTLKLRMDAFKNHGLYYRSGMLQSWNKMCFTQGILEISANLPNYGKVTGLWPGMWTMGNLGRPGYLGSTDGVWPYSYDSCDAGITPNQSSPDGISYLPGQRLSACTCDGEDHPNPGVGRGAPEIDVLEGEVDTVLGVGIASQSLQVAPFDIWYMPDYDFIEVYNFTTTQMNGYCGGPFQQAVSAVSTLNRTWYEFGPDSGYYQKYAIEYLNDDEDGYVRWFVGDDPTYTIYAKALHPNGNIGWRRISKEPMSVVLNLGISNNWAYIDWRSIFFPVTMSIDYVRVYQPSDAVSITCDPVDFPTYDYIESHKVIYQNPNITKFELAGFSMPKNILTGNCKSSKFSLSNS